MTFFPWILSLHLTVLFFSHSVIKKHYKVIAVFSLTILNFLRTVQKSLNCKIKKSQLP